MDYSLFVLELCTVGPDPSLNHMQRLLDQQTKKVATSKERVKNDRISGHTQIYRNSPLL